LFITWLGIAALLFVLNDSLEEITPEFLKLFCSFRLLFLRFHCFFDLFGHSEGLCLKNLTADPSVAVFALDGIS